jgi:hypothetical protein
MKTQWEAFTVRLNLQMRTDIKDAMEELRARRHRAEGGYVSLGRVYAEAALLLLESEGISIATDESGKARKPLALPAPKPAKSDTRRKRGAIAVRAS